jgi:type IV pilus biogenesis protein CpaD/CtpE
MMRLEKMFVISAVVGIALATGACSEHSLDLWQNSHKAEGPGFGDSHRQMMAKHIVNPEPVKPTDMDSAVEAERLSVGMKDYMKGGATSGKGAGAGAKK